MSDACICIYVCTRIYVYVYVYYTTTIVFIHLVPKARVSMKNNNKLIPCGLVKKKKKDYYKPRIKLKGKFVYTHIYIRLYPPTRARVNEQFFFLFTKNLFRYQW